MESERICSHEPQLKNPPERCDGSPLSCGTARAHVFPCTFVHKLSAASPQRCFEYFKAGKIDRYLFISVFSLFMRMVEIFIFPPARCRAVWLEKASIRGRKNPDNRHLHAMQRMFTFWFRQDAPASQLLHNHRRRRRNRKAYKINEISSNTALR